MTRASSAWKDGESGQLFFQLVILVAESLQPGFALLRYWSASLVDLLLLPDVADAKKDNDGANEARLDRRPEAEAAD